MNEPIRLKSIGCLEEILDQYILTRKPAFLTEFTVLVFLFFLILLIYGKQVDKLAIWIFGKNLAEQFLTICFFHLQEAKNDLNPAPSQDYTEKLTPPKRNIYISGDYVNKKESKPFFSIRNI